MIYKEKEFDYKGYKCVVLFLHMGYRCGYVSIPKQSKLYGKNYDDIDVYCHGGLTYSKDYLNGIPEQDLWWIGFDCGHYGDGKDFKAAKKYFSDPKVLDLINQMEYLDNMFPLYEGAKSLEFCEQECMQIVDQIIEMEREVGA